MAYRFLIISIAYDLVSLNQYVHSIYEHQESFTPKYPEIK